MKPHLPLQLLGLALLTCAVPAAFGDSNTISINFTTGQEGATYDAGADWYDAANNTGSTAITADGDHDGNYKGGGSGVTLDYSSKNTWGYTDGVNNNMLKGYLDDGTGVNISLSGLIAQGFLTYSLTIYAATDTADAQFSSKNVNGVDYTSDGNGGATANATTPWGHTQGTSVSNDNSFTIGGLTGDLTIQSARKDVGSDVVRGCIAGIKVVNTYAGTPGEASLNGNTAATWTMDGLAGSAWTNNDSYAALTLTGENAMTVSDGVNTDAIIALGSTGDPSSLTLTGGTITLTGPSIVSTGTGVTLTVNSALSAAGVVTIDGEGKTVIGGQTGVGGLGGGGNLEIASGGKVTIGGEATSSFTGALAVADWSNADASFESTNANWSFAGTAVFNAANTGTTNGSITYAALSAYSGDLLSAADAWKLDGLTLTLTDGDNLSKKIIADTVTKTGDGEATISNGSVDIGTLNIDAGTVALNAAGYTIGTVNVASNAILSLSKFGASISSRPTINLNGGGLDVRTGNATLTADIVVNGSGTIGGSYEGNTSNFAGTIKGNGSLTFKDSLVNSIAMNAYIVSAAISDKAERESLSVVIDKVEGGSMTFSSANTYTGGTTVKSGQLILTGSGTTGTGAVAIETAGAVRIEHGMTWDNVTSGNGQFIVNASGQTVTVSRGVKDAWENSFAGFTGTVDIQNGTLQLGSGDKTNASASLGSGKIKIAGGAVLGLQTGNIALSNAMDLADGARINVLDGDGAGNKFLNYNLQGDLSLAGSATIAQTYNKSVKLSGTISDAAPTANPDGTVTNHSGKLILTSANTFNYGHGIFILAGNNNTFSGGVDLQSGILHVEGNESLGTGTTTVANGAELSFKREGGNTTSAAIQVNNADGAAVATLKAKPAEARAADAPVYTNIKVESTGITRVDANKKASVANAALDISSTYSISNAELNDTLITLNNAAALTLTDVTLGAGTVFSKDADATTTLTVNNSSLILSKSNTTIGSDTTTDPTTALVTYDMAGATIEGSFTLSFEPELLMALSKLPGNPFTQVTVTLDNVGSWTVNDADLHLQYPWALEGTAVVDTTTAGQVSISITFDQVIPEPATATLGLTALLGLMMRRRRRG